MNNSLKRYAVFRALRREWNYLCGRRMRGRRSVRGLLGLYGPGEPEGVSQGRMIVFMADGRSMQGGWVDRLHGIVSLWRFARGRGYDFRINYCHPIRLERYLEPAGYDWRLRPGELTYNSDVAHPFRLMTFGETGPREWRFQQDMMERYLSGRWRQCHVYSSYDYADGEMAGLFAELFRPTELLAGAMRPVSERLGEGYVSVSTRFMELLGDFVEPKRARLPLAGPEREELVGRCLEAVGDVHRRHPDARVFVTSDSALFLSRASALPYVVVAEGDICHADLAADVSGDADPHLKTFVDFMLVAGASKAYQIKAGSMYGGNFSRCAALVGGVEFERIDG
ncbi:MAG: hypothetical protein K2L26_08865 [Duncaniella sp.]|nr:hypothetical protein [Duncaniella sp.]